MKKSTLQKVSLFHAWQLPLKERLTRLLIPTHSKDGKPFFQGLAFALNGCLVHVNTTNYIEYKIFAEGGYEVYLTNLIKHFLRANSTFLDIGANIGIHSLGVATQPNVKIYAFEPIDFIREKFKNNIALNNYSNITIVPLALSNENKTIKTNFGSHSSNQGTFSIQNEAEGVNIIKCKIGDDFVNENNISTISVIKIDVEGFEMHVLQGLKQTIKNQNQLFSLNSTPTISIGQTLLLMILTITFKQWATNYLP